MRGIVLSSKSQSGEGKRYWMLVEGEGAIREMRSAVELKPGETVETNDEGESIQTASINDDTSALQKASEFAEKLAESVQRGEVYVTGNAVLDSTTARMWEKFQLCRSILIRKLALAAPVIVRFHNDADGAGGAFGLYRSIGELAGRRRELQYRHNITWMMQQNVSYTVYDSNLDIMIAESYSSMEKPLLLVIDFGTSLESNNGMDRVKDKFDIIWLDHHPIVEGFKGLGLESYVNPWNFGGDSSYTAGFLACAFSKTFSGEDTREIENASLCGDYSVHAVQGGPGSDLSLLLDLVTSDSKVAFGSATSNITPYEIEKLVLDKEKSGELLNFARARLGEIMDSALKSMKRYRGEGAHIYVLDFEGIRDDQSKYPLPGRFSSKLLDKIVELKKEPSIVAVHSGRYISIRVSRELVDRVDLQGLIERIKESYGELIEAGGGHAVASGIKLADKVEKEKVLREMVSILKEQLSKKRGTEEKA